MTPASQLAAGLADLRESLQADGADLELEGVEDGVATVRLLVGPETCLECIVPKPILESVVLVALQKHDASIARVDVVDPRPA
ncbi:MAG TPA: hypothetical protein VJT84_05520 [Gaiellaceae bacterium]|nr:hypothetical protein [Gaiellaceae bacterium]